MPLEWTPLHTPTAVENNRFTTSIHIGRLSRFAPLRSPPRCDAVDKLGPSGCTKQNTGKQRQDTASTWVAVSARDREKRTMRTERGG